MKSVYKLFPCRVTSQDLNVVKFQVTRQESNVKQRLLSRQVRAMQFPWTAHLVSLCSNLSVEFISPTWRGATALKGKLSRSRGPLVLLHVNRSLNIWTYIGVEEEKEIHFHSVWGSFIPWMISLGWLVNDSLWPFKAVVKDNSYAPIVCPQQCLKQQQFPGTGDTYL